MKRGCAFSRFLVPISSYGRMNVFLQQEKIPAHAPHKPTSERESEREARIENPMTLSSESLETSK